MVLHGICGYVNKNKRMWAKKVTFLPSPNLSISPFLFFLYKLIYLSVLLLIDKLMYLSLEFVLFFL